MTLLPTLRRAAKPGTWSAGVSLSRTAAVTLVKRSETEVVLRVKTEGRAVAPTVFLYLEEPEWTCDCDHPQDPCPHVIAAALILEQGEAGGAATPEEPRAPERHLGYRLLRESDGVSLMRVVVSPSGEQLLDCPLEHPRSRELKQSLLVSEDDLALDRLIGSNKKYRILSTLRAVFTALRNATDIRLEGTPVRVDPEPVMPRARVLERGRAVLLELSSEPSIDEVIAPGLARRGALLCPLGATELTGLRLEKLPLSQVFERERLGELVGRVLPELERSMPIEILTGLLPGRSRTLRPRVTFTLLEEGASLVVTAHLVYGDPPEARVDNGRLVQLGTQVPRRDLAAETTLGHKLRDELDLLFERPLHLEGLGAGRFMEKLSRWDQKASQKLSRSELVPTIQSGADGPLLCFVNPSNPADALALEVVLAAEREGISALPLPSGGFGQLPALVSSRREILSDLVACRADAGRNPGAELLLFERATKEFGLSLPEGFPELLSRLLSESTAQPSALDSILRDYQRRGVSWLMRRRDAGLGAILADDMGLGKTLQAIAVLTGRSLIVAPRSVLENWHRELTRFRPELSVAIYHGRPRALEAKADVTLTTYAVLRLDVEPLEAVAWDVLVLDEAQNIRNPDSQVAEAAFRLSGKFRLALTGTPIENRLLDLWSEMRFVLPGLLGGLAQFRARFVAPLDQGDHSAAERLLKLISLFVLRRLKRDVAPELPPRTDDTLWIELEPSERQRYDALESTLRADVEASESKNSLQILTAILRLRQAACHLGLVPGESAETSAKLERLTGALEELMAEGQRALVFSQWTSLLDRIGASLTERGVDFVRLDGSTRARDTVVSRFQDEAGPPVMLVSLMAGGTGLNLTAADHVFIMDPWWNPTTESQAADRAHRIGRTRPVFVHRLVAKETIEERVMALKEKKQGLTSLLDGGEPEQQLSRDELLELLG